MSLSFIFRSLNWSLALAVSWILSPELLRSAEPSATEQTFQTISQDFVRAFHDANPLAGVALGWHQYDGRFVVPTATHNAAFRQQLHEFRRRLAALDRTQLSLPARRDLVVLENRIGTSLMFADRLRWTERSPLAYADQPDISIYLKRDWKPLDDRVRDMTAILRLAPAHFAAARTNLELRLPRPWIELGLLVAEGTASFWEKDVATEAARATNAVVRGEFAVANTAAIQAYYQEKPARSEAMRGTMDPGYGFYTLGKLQLLQLRSDWKAQEGERYTPQRFHDEVLRHGMPPIRMLREMMLRDPALWEATLR